MSNLVLASTGAAGMSVNFGLTRYLSVHSSLTARAGTTAPSFYVHSSEILKSLWVRVRTNTLDGNTVLRVLKNGGLGNQGVTIGAGLTGIFQDTTNTDSFVDGDTVVHRLDTTASTVGSINIMEVSVVMQTITTGIKQLATEGIGSLAAGSTTYFMAAGNGVAGASETFTQVLVRTTAILSRLAIYVSANAAAADSFVRLRKNTANGNQVITIGAGLTGYFEDNINTDSLVAGDVFNFVATIGAGGAVNINRIQTDETSPCFHAFGGIPSAGTSSLTFGSTAYSPFMAAAVSTALAESLHQMPFRVPLALKNLIVRAKTNTLNGSTVVRIRKNSGNGGQLVTIGAGLTGLFEDNTNQDLFTPNDLGCLRVDTAGNVGSIEFGLFGTEQWQLPIRSSPASELLAKRII